MCISSVAGRLGYAYWTPYAATKWAIIGLLKSLAIELGQSGICINAFLPGIVEGPALKRLPLSVLGRRALPMVRWNRNTSIKHRCGGW